MEWRQRNRLTLAAVLLLGTLAAAQGWLADLRPPPPDARAETELAVTSPADGGPGSLREAIFIADRAPVRVRVRLLVPRVRLESPLPPLVNPRGIVLEAAPGGTEIDAGALREGAALDLDGPSAVVRGVTVRGAREQGILVRGSGARLEGVTLAACGEGVRLLGDAREAVIENARFTGNGTGLRLDAGGSATLRGSELSGHQEAAVWAVAPAAVAAGGAGLTVRGNRFSDDRISLVLGNFPARVEDNDLVDAREAAIYLMGGGAVVEGNSIRGAAGVGIYADGPEGALLARNEVTGSKAIGILVRAGRNAVVQGNRSYDNGYGIAVVFGDVAGPHVLRDNLLLRQRIDGIIVVGGSPVIRGNRVLASRAAGLRVLDYVPREGPRVVASPLVGGNTFETNGSDRPQRGDYVEPPPEETA